MNDLSQRVADLSPAKRKLLEQKMGETAGIVEPIAIVGMGCRFPGADNIEAYWRLIEEGIDATGEIPASRWNIDDFYDPTGETPGKMSTRWGGFIDKVDQFDPLFFGIAPREAEKIDPQHRLLLETAWEALEYGSLSPDELSGSACGVFIGIGTVDYSRIPSQFDNPYEQIGVHGGTGNALSIAANRLSYFFNLRGPSLAVDTACSSSLVAIHLAARSLENRECDAAFAGGVNLILTPEATIAFSKAHMLSPDGQCRPFDAAANGYVRGEGCGIIVLKRLTDAIDASDNILALLRGTAVNQDGRTSGITAPNALAQQAAIRQALAGAGITPQQVTYVEAHGTATPLGDRIEVQSLTKIFRGRSSDAPPCYLGSVKANIGHTETAAGVAGVIKVVLMMRHGWIPAQLHLKELNPNIALAGSRVKIPSSGVPWQFVTKRIAGVSAYGFGGTNAHVVLEHAQAAKRTAVESDRPCHVLTISGKTEKAVSDLAKRFDDYLDNHPNVALADLCYTANAGRTHFNHRLAVIAESHAQLREGLIDAARGTKNRNVRRARVSTARRPRVAFLFTGQGSQYVGMGRALYERHPVFRKAMGACDEILRDFLDESLLSVLYGDSERSPLLDQTAYAQPALFALEYALGTLWRSWGIEPDYVLGHSVGEYPAACIAGVFGLEDGLRLIAHRARLMQELPHKGLMAAVLTNPRRVAQMLAPYAGQVSIAAQNGPENTVISGAAEAVETLVRAFEAQGIRTQPLNVSHAFHSPLMESLLDDFEALAQEIDYQCPTIPLASNLTGELITLDPPDARYWRNHIRHRVRFVEGMRCIGDARPDAIIEIGPSTTLLELGRRCLPKLDALWLPSLQKGKDDWHAILPALAELYVHGACVDWPAFDRPWPRRKLVLPTYPFQRSRYWLDTDGRKRGHAPLGSRGRLLHPILGYRLPSADTNTLFEARWSSSCPKYMADHRVRSATVVPAAAYIEQALAAAEQVFGVGKHVVENVSIQQAMVLSKDTTRVVQLIVSPEASGQRTFKIYSSKDTADLAKGRWSFHACGKLLHERPAEYGPSGAAIDLCEIRDRTRDGASGGTFYERMAKRGLAYGPTFQLIESIRWGEREALAEVRLPKEVSSECGHYHLHPALLDACFQSMAPVVPHREADASDGSTYVPTFVRRVCIHGKPTRNMLTYAVRTSIESVAQASSLWPEKTGKMPVLPESAMNNLGQSVEGDVLLVDHQGQVLVELLGVRVQRLGKRQAVQRPSEIRDWTYQVHWRPQSLLQSTRNTKHSLSDSPNGWVVFADKLGVGREVARRLGDAENQCVLVVPDDDFSQKVASSKYEAATYGIDPLAESNYRQLLDTLGQTDNVEWRGMIHLWSLDIPALDESGPNSFETARRLGCGSVLQLIRQLARAGLHRSPKLWLVTRGAEAVHEEERMDRASQSPIWGMGRTAALEHAELECRLVDLDPLGDVTQSAKLLAREVARSSEENQIAYRQGSRHVARLERTPDVLGETSVDGAGVALPRGRPFRLRLGLHPSIGSLRYESFVRRRPEPGQVAIQVQAAGLNFSDVLKAMGLYPGITDEVVPLGIECAGLVTAVGEGVDRFSVGDAVMGVAPFSFASGALTAEHAIVHKPKSFSAEQACTIPIAFLTAYYALGRLANLQRGERVLIHAAAGGVGLAAIQIARHVGAEIYATAGSDRKREFLRSVGVKHVMNSRTLEFADQIMEITNREGVDVVLNSLPGDAVSESLSTLGAYGRFLEIGKTDIYQNRMIGLLPFQNNLSYFAIDLDRMLRERPDYIRNLFTEVMEHFERGDFQPLVFTQFPTDDTIDAFRYMAQRKNIGKVVVSIEQRDDRKTLAPAASGPIRVDGSYLITGGMGALGMRVAAWLVDLGARYLVLLSRRPPSDEVAQTIESLRASGVDIAVIRGDVAEAKSLTESLAQLPKQFPPLRGVVHAAGVLDDGLMFDMDLARLDRVLAPKVQGAWNLHVATLDSPLDFFVMFSSVASILGSPGQANYAAANAFMDGLARYRRAGGRPATSINWGPWAESGMAAATVLQANKSVRGMEFLPPDRALDGFGRILRAAPTNITVMNSRWNDLLHAIPGRCPPLLEHFAAEGVDDAAAGNVADANDHQLRATLLGAEPDERKSLLRDYLVDELGEIMGINPASLDVDQPLGTLGLDSLMAVELKNSVEARLKCELPMAALFENPSVNSLVDCVTGAFASGGCPTNDSETPQFAGVDRALDARASAWSPVVTLASHGDLLPLFCLHPVGGDVRCYFDVARKMDPDRPVHALRARGLDRNTQPQSSMREMVADYLDCIRDIQPEGPYFLCGWSTGGIFAYELARCLQERGESIGLLALLDSPTPDIFGAVDLEDHAKFLYDLVDFSKWFTGSEIDVSYEELKAQGLEESLSTVLREAKRSRVLAPGASVDDLGRQIAVCREHVRILMQYKPAPSSFPVQLLYPADTSVLAEASRRRLTKDLGWREILSDGLSLREVPGHHFSMMLGENAAALGNLLEECIRRSDEGLGIHRLPRRFRVQQPMARSKSPSS